MNQQTINKVSVATEQLKVMKETLDQDIARAAIACVNAEDATLMQQLVDEVPQAHEFAPMLQQLVLEMQTAKQKEQANDQASLDHRLTLMTLAKTMAEAYTDTLDTETLVWESLFNTAIAHVPNSALAELAEGVEKQLNSHLADGWLTELPLQVSEQLKSMQQP